MAPSASTALLAKYNLPPDSLERTGIAWNTLQKISAHHIKRLAVLETAGAYFADRLRRVPQAHSLSVRIKDPEHLQIKVLRKRLLDPSRVIDESNYTTEVTDLIGLRVLHLFKEDWAPLHDFITSTWEAVETPVANHRKGDPETVLAAFTSKGCRLQEHRYGYRSAHYLVGSQPERERIIAEIQVRTLFEEGWSEIDHRLRYPRELENPVLDGFLGIFNRLAGSADEMGSFVAVLKTELSQRDEQYRQARADLETNLKEIKRLTEQLKLSEDQKRSLADRFRAAESFPSALSSFAPSITLGSHSDQFRLVMDSLRVPLPSTLLTANKELEDVLRRNREALAAATRGVPKLPKP